MVLFRVGGEPLHSACLLSNALQYSTFLWVRSVKHTEAATDHLPECAATRGTDVTSKLAPTSQQTWPGTRPLREALGTRVSVQRTSPRMETTPPLEGEQTAGTDRLPLLRARTAASAGSASPTLPGLGEKLPPLPSRVLLSCALPPSCSLWAHVLMEAPPLLPSLPTPFFLGIPTIESDVKQYRFDRDKQRHMLQAQCPANMYSDRFLF